MDIYFKRLEDLENELYVIFSTNEIYKTNLYWNKRNFIVGNMESIFYKIIVNGNEEEKLKAINKMCELYFTLNVNLYSRFIGKYEDIFKIFHHIKYLTIPIDIKELTCKNKKIIIEYYLLGEKIYTENKQFLYGILYFSSRLVSHNAPGGYHGDLVIGKQSEYMDIR